MHNVQIRSAAAASGIKLWQIADILRITDATFSRKLRKELPQEEKQRVLEAIDRLAREKQGVV